ncbi:MAG: Stringent starvation protein B [Rhizobiales bacterium]|nr:Stringent starvation protein B [Hyphomicrobiales bacterium]
MATDQIRYDLLVQEALRGVVRKVLANAARDGLPGEHYFHVEFETAAAGVRLSDRMRERFPDRMTIILQHHFWDLEVTEEALEVGLSFGGVAERVRVPFAALTGFFDESVQFGLRFELQDTSARREPDAQVRPAKAEKPRLKELPREAAKDATKEPAPAKRPAAKDVARPDAPAPEAPEKAASEGDGAKVLSIDAFRKKP